ncbi:MAG: bifunctional folylpolyglutamate synthase/dihydrofolate synthase [Chitinophagales bacterium]|nr:bifunctional folylpolyglutamate synthase/dihydrofolate synthase [Chitinophagales bacterium]
MKNYPETLDYIFSKLPMFQRVGDKAFKKDLTNIIALLKTLDNPHNYFKTIHIAGTNGKGSTTHIIASILQESGLKVACYTSPHYIDFRERIKINGIYISEQFVVDFINKIEPLIDEIKPSFFEITVAMAFQYFKEQKVDVAVVETGLGGRLDSTNIITPLLSVITNISFDHTNMLGNTLAEIAKEKAGIIKPNIPVVIGEYQEEIENVFRNKAKECNSQLYYAKEIVELYNFNSNFEGSTFETYFNKQKMVYTTDLYGNYQKKNIQTALASIFLLKKDFNITQNNIKDGLREVRKNTTFMGRNTILATVPKILADSAHNKAGIENLLETIKQISYQNLHVVYGTVADKDISAVLEKLPKKASYYFCKANIPRGLDAIELKNKAQQFNLLGENYKSVFLAFKQAKENAEKEDLILITGSIFVVAEVL